MENEILDVAIIGAGPVGMYTAFYCGLRKLTTRMFDSLEVMGGQVTSQYAEKLVYDLPGFLEIKGQDFIDKLALQLDTVSEFVQVSLSTNITNITKGADNLFTIESGDQTWFAKAIVLATGNGAFSPRPLGIENENQYQNICYFVNKLEQFRNRHVVIFGGGDSAVDWSLMLESIAASVTIIHRREEFRAKETSVDQLLNSSVHVHTPFVPVDVVAEDNPTIVTAVLIKHTKTDEIVTIPVDNIIVNFGVVSNLGFIKKWEALNISRNRIPVSHNGTTSVPGVFACGDICVYDNRQTQITTGLGEAVTLSAMVQQYVHPDSKARPIR